LYGYHNVPNVRQTIRMLARSFNSASKMRTAGLGAKG
jgi:hypothetical protein